MRDAIRKHLGPPADPASILEAAVGRRSEYVALYKNYCDTNGDKSWEICADDDCFQVVDNDGVGWFIVGVRINNQEDPLTWSTMFLTFGIESVTPEAITIRVVRMPGEFLIEPVDDSGFLIVAEQIIDKMIKILEEPPASFSGRTPIGFRMPPSH